MTADKDNYVELVRQAQLGDKQSRDVLAESARERLREYVYRLTLSEHLTQDILQESMLEMFKFLDKLEDAKRFWPWLRRIATNKINRHYRHAQQKSTGEKSEASRQDVERDGHEAVADLITQELKETIFGAMHELRPEYRKVLVLRCYEDMKYSEIAEEMNCSEVGARKLFCRAKNMLAKQLARRGLGKGSLLVALTVFGKMTASSEAAAANVWVTASAVKVGLVGSVAAMATTKTGIVALAAVGLVTAGSVLMEPSTEEAFLGPRQSIAANVVDGPQFSDTVNRGSECWYYYPPGSNGAVMMQLASGMSDGESSYCQWLHSDQANYYKRNGRIYVENHRMWNADMSVRRLPTDAPALREFLSTIEGRKERMRYIPDSDDGMLVVLKYDEDGICSQITRRYDVSDEEFFRYRWPAGAGIVDNRDPMHKRGWTYFRITGQINGKDVRGRGRMPFVYSTSKIHWPWLELKVGGEAVKEACFEGLSRPWMGLHTIDTVRRDAALQKVWFETKHSGGELKAEVVLTRGQTTLTYTIDMEKDVVERIELSTGDGHTGYLSFSYLQDIGQVSGEFAAPEAARFARQRQERSGQSSSGMLWLVRLAESSPPRN